jgi:hypothetical protein
MTQANRMLSMPPTNTSADNDPQSPEPCNCLMCIAEGDNSPHRDRPQSPATCELALHIRLKAAGMRLERVSNDSYRIVWRRHQMVVSDLTLLQAAMFVHRSLDR